MHDRYVEVAVTLPSVRARLMRLIRLGMVSALAGLAVAGAARVPEQVVLTSAVLAGTLGTRSAWLLVSRQGPAVEDMADNEAPGVITLCLRKKASGPCDPQVRNSLGTTLADALFSEPHYLDEARVVGGRGASGQPAQRRRRPARAHAGDGPDRRAGRGSEGSRSLQAACSESGI